MKIKQLVILAALAFGFLTNLSPALSLAADTCDTNSDGVVSTQEAIQCGANGANGGGDSTQAASHVNNTIKEVINLISVITAIAAVIMIIIGGFRYITSGGKQESVTGAKNTILYAVIGLVIVALAQVIVRFVLTSATTSTQSPSGSSGAQISPGAANSPH